MKRKIPEGIIVKLKVKSHDQGMVKGREMSSTSTLFKLTAKEKGATK